MSALPHRIPEAEVDPQFTARWSRRAFDGRPVEPAVLRSLFEAARWAPSASNAQPWLFIYHDDAASLDRVRPLLKDSNRRWADRAPVLIFVFARKLDPASGRPIPMGRFDTGAAWLSLALQAARAGLVTRAIAGIHHDRVYQTLGVPHDEFESMACIAVGHPGAPADLPEDLAAREAPSGRKKVDEFTFRGTYPRAQ